jgi:hypothetical protein
MKIKGMTFKVLLITILAMVGSFVYATDAELVWVEVGGDEYALVMSELSNEQWGDPERVYTTENPITSPALGGDSLGNKLLIWAEQIKNKTFLYSMRWTRNNGWSEAVLFSNRSSENFAPTLVFDHLDNAWVFWSSGGNGTLSDIYLSIVSNNGVSKAVRIHAQNEVPDSSPRAHVAQNGSIEVKWTSYDIESSQFKAEVKQFDAMVGSRSKIPEDELSYSSINLPSFFKGDGRAVLYFPRNNMVQSTIISQGGSID